MDAGDDMSDAVKIVLERSNVQWKRSKKGALEIAGPCSKKVWEIFPK